MFSAHTHAASALALALVLTAGGPATGQTPRTGRVTITSGPPAGSLPAPRRTNARSNVMARTAFDVHSWFDRTEAPPVLASAPRGAVVLARELTLENRHYVVDTPLLVIVADSLRIGPNAVIDVSGRQVRAAGGKVVVLARRITCESGGHLQLIAKGGAQGGQGGNVVVVAGSTEGSAAIVRAPGNRRPRLPQRKPLPPSSQANRVVAEGALPPCVTGAVDGGPGAVGEVRDHRLGRPPVSTRTIPPGHPGRIIASSLRTAVQSDAFVQTAWSMWAVEWLQALQLDIYDASRTSNNPRVLKLLREYAAFDGPPELIAPDVRERYLAVLEDLNLYRKTALPPLSVEEVTVRPGDLPQNVTVFTEGATLRASLAPTHALASRASVGGRSVLGLLEYRNDHPDELAIEVEWELTVDPWSERLAADQLTKAGQRLEGVFAGWSLEPKPMQELGVKSAAATLLPGGRRLRVRFIVEAERANLVFWRLLNSAGIPWSVDWTFREPETGRVVTGTWAGPALSLMRQREPSVTIASGALVNAGSSPVTVNYVRAQDGSFLALNPVLRVNPGETIALPAAVGSAASVTVPAEAIETAFDPERFASDFHVLNGEQVVDRVVIKNNLPTSDATRGAFDFVELTVSAAVDGDTAVGPAVAGPFRLSATGTRGGEISIPFLRLARGTRRITVEGRAHYADGYRTLKPTTFDTLSVTLTHDMFRE